MRLDLLLLNAVFCVQLFQLSSQFGEPDNFVPNPFLLPYAYSGSGGYDSWKDNTFMPGRIAPRTTRRPRPTSRTTPGPPMSTPATLIIIVPIRQQVVAAPAPPQPPQPPQAPPPQMPVTLLPLSGQVPPPSFVPSSSSSYTVTVACNNTYYALEYSETQYYGCCGSKIFDFRIQYCLLDQDDLQRSQVAPQVGSCPPAYTCCSGFKPLYDPQHAYLCCPGRGPYNPALSKCE